MELSYTEENYLKSLFKIGYEKEIKKVGANELANYLNVKPASVTEMLKKIKEKGLVDYERYGKIQLTKEGEKIGIEIIRKHRLWETFLFEKLDFSWDEVHEIAEELEHIKSKKLIDQLDKFLDFPKFDPHGDPIPNAEGVIKAKSKIALSQAEIGKTYKMVSVKDNSASFLQYVVNVGLGINNEIKVVAKEPFDGQTTIEVNGVNRVVSHKFTENIYVI